MAQVVSAVDRATPPAHRRRVREITSELAAGMTGVADPDHDERAREDMRDGMRDERPREVEAGEPGTKEWAAEIVVSATAAGLRAATLRIPLTTDLGMRAVAVAGGPRAERLDGFR